MKLGSAKYIFERQFMHWVLLGALLTLLLSAASRLDGFWDGQLLGISTGTWFLLALANTIIHQFYVWFCWRLELHGKLLTKIFKSSAFTFYAVGFTMLIALRPVLITALAISNRSTFSASPVTMKIVGLIILLPAAYLGYFIVNYFGFTRAFGIDHFEPSYRSLPLVRDGIFRFTPNAMYLFGFCLLWAPAIFFSSVAALTFALFSHLYIWVHYFTVEKPDMAQIYGK
jgi:protein-S-isoprenylcysteine O-methyltransferase Ste14